MTFSFPALRSRLEQRNSDFWRKAIIVVATLFLAYYLGRQPSMLYIQLPLLLVVFWTVMQYPALGLVAIVVSALVIPFAIGTGTQTSLHLAFVLIPVMTTVWFFNMLRARAFRMVPSRTNLPLMGYILIVTIALIYGNLPVMAFAQHAPIRSQLGAWAIFVFSGLAFLLVGNTIKDIRWLKVMVGLFLGISFIYFLGKAIPGAEMLQRVLAPGATGSVLWLWFVALTGGLFLFHRQLKPGLKVLLGLMLVCAFYAALQPSQVAWASGWLPCTVVLFVLIFLRWPRLGLGLGVLGSIGALLNFGALQRFALAGDNQYSLLTRSAAAQIIGQIIQSNPMLGVGPANYYWYTPLFSLLGYYIRFNSHNQYIDFLAQVGLLGLACFLLFAVAALWEAWGLRRRVTDGFSAAYVNAAIAGLAGMLVAGLLGDWVVPFVYNIGVSGFRASVLGWLFLGGIIVIKQVAQRAEAGEGAVQAS